MPNLSTTAQSHEVVEGIMENERSDIADSVATTTAKFFYEPPPTTCGKRPSTKELTLDAGRECGPVHTIRHAVGQDEKCYQ